MYNIEPPVHLTYFQSTLELNHNNYKPLQLKYSGTDKRKHDSAIKICICIFTNLKKLLDSR